MEEFNDFEYFKNLINKEKEEQEILEIIYANDSKNYLINLNTFIDISIKIHKNICIGLLFAFLLI